ncbi:hypothetical protein EW093_13660 [Thiospirochaeta perfilievii]|uniref:Molybdopterin dehydrogenase FAD-binding domain-containing protein n=1 Tax=Thiospirochaeta perfilievii TaxID=252967 RepID=A0A5C1QGH3_9SPIO|nr:FAD binding domain-containing protein [Thiospirochaeta perfilievii]QEN05714.1 hypothetical protein EW093_13660 [Thiospirochaeta perfilievii]
MKKKGTRFFRPKTVGDLKEIVKKERDITLLAGGTSLFRTINGDNLIIPGVIIILDDIVELKKENRTERYFEFGSMFTIQEIICGSKNNLPKILLESLESMAPYPIRNLATIGGTIANKDIISDIIPLLLILNCKVEVIPLVDKKNRAKWESLTQYISTKDERGLHLITRVRIPLITTTTCSYYKTGHSFNLFKEISFSAIAEIEKSNISSLSMAFNIENKKIIRTKEIEAELIGKHMPISYRSREPLLSIIKTSLSDNPRLKESEIYRMAQIILHFLEGF